MRVGAGLSLASGTLAGIREAIGEALRAGGGTLPEAVLLWLTHHHAPALPAALEALRPGRARMRLAGCIAPGVIVGDREVFDAPAVAALSFHEGGPTRFATLLVRELSEHNTQAAQALVAALGPGDLGFAMLSTAAFAAARFAEGLGSDKPTGVILGGGAANPVGPDWVFTERGPNDDAMAVMIVRACHPLVGLSHSCRPVTRPLRITGAQGRILASLDGQPAARHLKALVRALGLTEQDVGRRLLVGIGGGPEAGLAYGRFVARPILGLEPRIGALFLGGEVAEGGWLSFLLRDPEWARRDLNGMALELKQRCRDRGAPSFGLVMECTGRGPGFQGMPEHDAPILAAHLGPAPSAGFFSGFELAPLPDEPASIHLFSTVALRAW